MEMVMVLRLPLVLVVEVIVEGTMREAEEGEMLPFLEVAAVEALEQMDKCPKAYQHQEVALRL